MAVLVLAAFVHAESVITLPLDGYYRPGKFFPVLVGGGKNIEIQVDHGISARATTDGVSGRLLPVMLLSPTTRSIRVVVDGQTREVPVRALESDQKLVIGVGGQLEIPGARVIRLPPKHQMTPCPWMYTSADYIGFPEGTFEMNDPAGPWADVGITPVELPQGKIVSLSAAKVGASRWRGPESSIAPAAYEAMESLLPARSPATRRAVWLVLALFAIVVAGISLLRWKHSAIAVAVASLVWLGVVAVYARRTARPVMAEGRIVFDEGYHTHRWIVRTSADELTESFTIGTSTVIRPLFADNAESLKMWIDPDDDYRFHYTLQPGSKVVFVLSEPFEPTDLPPATAASAEFLRDIAKRYYLRAGETIGMKGSEIVIQKNEPRTK